MVHKRLLTGLLLSILALVPLVALHRMGRLSLVPESR